MGCLFSFILASAGMLAEALLRAYNIASFGRCEELE